MTCVTLHLGGGNFAKLCLRGQRSPRCACGAKSSRQCDAPRAGRRSTCSRHLCDRCTTRAGELDYCSTHRALADAPRVVQRASPQLELALPTLRVLR